MRISDWSSDVCSSDLLTESTDKLREENQTYLSQSPKLAKKIAQMGETSATYGFFSAQAMVLGPVAILAAGELMAKWGKPKNKSAEEIGGASCRERGVHAG